MKKNSNILRKTSRKELIEMLLLQNKKIEELTYELENLKNTSNEENLKILSSGTLAEAALKLNKIFEDADAAAKLYLDNIKELEIQYKKKNQIYLNTWHGIPLKYIGNDCPGRNDYNFDTVDYLTVSGDYDECVFKSAFNAREESYLRCGMPRNEELWLSNDYLKVGMMKI